MALPPFVEALGHGVHAIDTGFHRPRFDAAYLLVHGGRAAFIDTGTNFAVPRLLQALDALGLARDAVDWVIPTHVHLDHAGGAGLLMRELPGARLYVHPRGARHMIDPSALFQGALAVYGAPEMSRAYGTLLGIDASRVDVSHDGATLMLADRPLHVIDTPGHARHHHCIWDAASRGWFTGDTFGLSYREFDTTRGPWIVPTATPVQFEPELLAHSIRRMMSFEPAYLYLTHFGRVGEVARLGALLLGLLEQMTTAAREERNAADRHAALIRRQLAIFRASLAEHGCQLPPEEVVRLLAMDTELNAQGMAIWLDRKA
jgi:glyoxylase-like metal-dependent hydrolase (beta-lactamase superfamily II)